MSINYYLMVFPMEAMIASQLSPEEFGTYMATGKAKSTAEPLIFIEVEGGFGNHFDWKYAEEKCVNHADGRPKNSLYLSVYRSLENTPVDKLGTMHLVTMDGRSLSIEKSDYEATNEQKGYGLYKELCPVNPLVVSSLDAGKFADYLTGKENKLALPSIVFADLKVVDVEHMENSGNVGNIYDGNQSHLMNCLENLKTGKGKLVKVVDRSYSHKFGYQAIQAGLFCSDGKKTVMYKMPGLEELKEKAYDWAKSANII